MRPCSAVILPAALVTCLAWAGGCAAPPPASYGPSVSGSAAPQVRGGSWEVVFPGGNTGPMLAAGPEAMRLDGLLVREQANVVDQSYWPEPPAKSLHRLRRLFLRGNPGEVLYYRNAPLWHPPPQPYRYWGW